jgi:hypothetical protein
VSTQRATPSDLEIALFLQREKHRLPKQYRGLVDRTVRYLKDLHWSSLGPHTRRCLHGLFSELGGKIT